MINVINLMECKIRKYKKGIVIIKHRKYKAQNTC